MGLDKVDPGVNQEESMVLLGIRSHAYIIDVWFHLGASGYDFLHHGSRT